MILERRAAGTGVVSIALALLAAACGAGSTSGGGDADRARVVATTSIWADITSAVLCGLDVPALIPAGADPHTFEPSLRDREILEQAEIVVTNGGGLEESLADLLSTVASDGTNVVELAPFVDTIATDDDDDDDHDDDDDDHDDDDDGHDDDAEPEVGADPGVGAEAGDPHGHELAIDPHLWQDPRRVAAAVDVIVSAAGASDLPDCADDYRRELAALDDEIVVALDDIPPASRVMVTSHDSLAYFADRYDLEIVGTVIPSINTLAETNAADLAELADVIDARAVRAIFTEELESTADADALAARLGVRVVPLVTDALTADPESDTYIEMMRTNASRIAGALTP